MESFEVRKAEASRMKKKYPNRIPVVVRKDPRAKVSVPDIEKNKFLLPTDLTASQLLYIVRSRIELKPEDALFLLINNKLLSPSAVMSDVYLENHHEDGFLYVVYTVEGAFGA